MPQLYDTSGSGGYLAVPELSRKVRKKSLEVLKFGQFVRPEKAFGVNRGGTIYFDVVDSDITLAVTYQSDELVEDLPIPEGEFAITQNSATVKEYGKAISYSGKLTNLGQISIEPIVEINLRNRMAKVLDAVHARAFKTAGVSYTPTSAVAGTWDTDGTITTTATANGNAFHIREIVDYMFGNLLIPPYNQADDEYICICTQKFLRGLYDDPDFEKVQNYAEPQQRLRGEVGRYYRTRFVVTNHSGALTNGVGTNSVLGEAIFFGEDPIIHPVAIAPEIRVKSSDRDFGRSIALAWYGLFTSASTFTYTANGQVRTVYVSSAP